MFIDDLVKGGITGILEGVKKAVSAFKADPTKVIELEVAIQQLEIDLQKTVVTMQAEINKLDAVSQDKFQSRWRPFIGWVCGFAYAYTFVVQPFLVFLAHLAEIPVTLPDLDWTSLEFVLFGMLGIGAMRSYDKRWGNGNGNGNRGNGK